MSEYLIADVVRALGDGQMTYNQVVAALSGTLRTGITHPDLEASLNYALHQGKIRWVEDRCGRHPNAFEHGDDCLLEVA